MPIWGVTVERKAEGAGPNVLWCTIMEHQVDKATWTYQRHARGDGDGRVQSWMPHHMPRVR